MDHRRYTSGNFDRPRILSCPRLPANRIRAHIGRPAAQLPLRDGCDIEIREARAALQSGISMSSDGAGGERIDPGGWAGIVRHYENCLDRYGATPQGADWPNGADLAARFGVMSTLMCAAGQWPSLLDLGCGPGLLLDYLADRGWLYRLSYQGIDLSPAMIDAARARWPDHAFSCRDILVSPLPEQSVDL